jgi:alpha-glucosidase
LIDVVGNYSAFNLPLDTQWNDIDYLFNYRDFTYDNFRYKNLSDFVDYLHNNKSMYYVPILDGGIAMRD